MTLTTDSEASRFGRHAMRVLCISTATRAAGVVAISTFAIPTLLVAQIYAPVAKLDVADNTANAQVNRPSWPAIDRVSYDTVVTATPVMETASSSQSEASPPPKADAASKKNTVLDRPKSAKGRPSAHRTTVDKAMPPQLSVPPNSATVLK